MSIADQVHDFKVNVAATAPAHIAGVFRAEQRHLAESTDRSALVAAGDTLEDFVMPDATEPTSRWSSC